MPSKRPKPRRISAMAPGYKPPTLQRIAIWLETAAPGDRVVYHKGPHLGVNNEVARTMLRAAECGIVHLTQARVLHGMYYDYIATRALPQLQRQAECA